LQRSLKRPPTVITRAAIEHPHGGTVAQNDPVLSTDLRPVDYLHPDAQLLIDEVQQEYVRRYGGPDSTPVDRQEFSPPNGHFVVLYDAGRPVAMGGWRFSQEARLVLGDPDPVVELKRMYVIPAGRGRGHARTVLAHLEHTAALAGAGRMVLETGAMQPEAVALYLSTGYQPIPAFGHYADSEHSIHLGKLLSPGC
jgi:GNAT superfamily N-acetyltransferase